MALLSDKVRKVLGDTHNVTHYFFSFDLFSSFVQIAGNEE
jgi:hypothetical protein